MMAANDVAHVSQQQTLTPAGALDESLGQAGALPQTGGNGLDLAQQAQRAQQAQQAQQPTGQYPAAPDYAARAMQAVDTGENLQNLPQRQEPSENTALSYAKNLATFAAPEASREDIVASAVTQATSPQTEQPATQQAATAAEAAVRDTLTGEAKSDQSAQAGTPAGAEAEQPASAYRDISSNNLVGADNRLVGSVSMEDTEAMIASYGRQVSRKAEAEEDEAPEAESRTDAALGTQSDKEAVGQSDDSDANLGSVPEQAPAPQRRQREIYAPNNTYYTEVKAQKEDSKKAAAGKQWDGNAFTEKVVASRDVEPYAVSVGSSIIREMIREPGNNLIDIVNAASSGTYTQDQLLFDETAFRAFVDTINNEQIYVIAVKSPVQQPASSQARVLRVHYGRGVAVHPTQTKSYNLDFDGDGVTVQLGSLRENKVFRTSMDYLVAIDGGHNIDDKFFPWPKLGTRDRGEYRDRFKELFLADVYRRADTTKVADALYDIAYPAEGADRDELYRRFVEELDALARPGWRQHDRDLSDMLMNIFDVSVYINELAEASHYSSDGIADYINGQRLSDQMELTADQYIAMQISDMAVGKLPPNFQDFLIGLNRYIGEIDDANVVFRLGADIAKRIKFSSQTVMGKEGAWELYQHTLEAGMAMYMNGRASIGERVNHVQQIARKYVIESTGFPAQQASPQEFLKKFAMNFNYFMSMANAAKGNYDDRLTPISDDFFGREDAAKINLRIDDDASIDDYAKALKMIYGEYTVRKVFGDHLSYRKKIDYDRHNEPYSDKRNKGNSILKRYASYSISKLCRTNHLDVYNRQTRFADATFTDIFLSLADQRTALTSKFNRELEELLGNMYNGFKDYEKHYATRNDNPADYSAYANDLMFAMHLSGPEMFSYFDMTDASKFLNSKWGRLLKKAADTKAKRSSSSNARQKIEERESRKSPDFRKSPELVAEESHANAMGGIRMAMVVEYRLRNVSAINRAISQMMSQAEITEADVGKINALQNRMASELNALASSSDLWEILVREIAGDNSVYQGLIADHPTGKKIFYDDLAFWESRKAKSYNGLLDVLRDTDLSKIEKELIAADCLRRATGFSGFKSYEVSYQLEIGPRSNFTSVATMAYRDDPDILDDLQESNSRLKQFFNANWESVREDVAKARQAASIAGPGTLDNYVRELASNPQLYLQINDDAVVDAINAQMDKTSRASEKAHQEIPVKWLYNALSLQKGGHTNIMHRVFDRTFGVLSSQTISAYDLIQVLANPELSFDVYDGDNRWTLSRESICGGTSEEALWDMLEANPRIAAMLRPGVATSVDKRGRIGEASHSYRTTLIDAMFSSIETNEGGGIVGASIRRNDAQSFDDAVKSYLFDKPMFLATVAMMRPQKGRTRASMRTQTKYAMNDIRQWLIELAARRYRGGTVDIADEMRKQLGVTEDTLVSRGGMEPDAAHRWMANSPDSGASTGMVYAFDRYVSDIADMIADGGFHDAAMKAAKDIRDANKKSKADRFLDFDASSVALAVDVRQTMTGAKTETSTAIEGGITQQNTGLALYAMGVKDRYSILVEGMDANECAPFAGGITNAIGDDGRFVAFSGDPADIPRLMTMISDGSDLVVEATDPNWVKDDETLAHKDQQIPSLSRMALVKRTKSAEKFNLKAKKAGDDGRDSITKTARYSSESQRNLGIVRAEYESKGIFGAKLAIASIIRKADLEEGYDDMDFSDYLDIADAMIVESENAPGYVLRTPGEISLAIRMNLDQDIADSGVTEDIIVDAHRVADTIGSQGNAVGDKARKLSLMLLTSKSRSSFSSSRWKPTKNPAMSSEERSFGLLKRIMSGQSNVRIPWSNEEITDQKPRGILPSRERRRLDEGFRGNRPIPAWTPRSFQIVGYEDGRRYDDDLKPAVSAGPRSAWYLNEGASQPQIDSVLKRCYFYGMTLIFPDPKCLGDRYDALANDIAEIAPGQYALSFFDMRLNGMSTGSDVAMAPASYQFDPSNLWYTVEDSRNLYGAGDSQIITGKHAGERAQCVAADRHSMSVDDFFYNTREAFKDRCGFPQLASREEIEKYIVNWKDGGPELDLGLAPSNKNFDKRLEKLRLQLEEYRANFAASDAEFGILPEAQPDRILGWMVMYVDGREDPVFAPIIPWPTGSALSAPTRFSVDGIYLDPDTDTVNLDWRITENIDGQVAKVHDGFGGAGKGMTMLNRSLDLGRLRSGHEIDAIVAASSFASRRLAWGKRMCTLKSLAMTMSLPPYGYNYAEHDASFPDNPEVKERLKTERIPLDEWPELIKGVGRFSSDPTVDSLLKSLVNEAIRTGTTNPSDILATRYGDSFPFMYVDYDFFFGTKIEFQNALMKWYNSMQPTVCPPSIEEFGDGGYLFRPVTYADGITDEYEYGCLQMAVPHRNPNTGGTFYHWENVYISMSFFNDDFSGLHKPGLNGAHRSMEQNNAIAMSGRKLSKKQMRAFAKNAVGVATRTYNPYDLELDYGRFIAKREAR